MSTPAPLRSPFAIASNLWTEQEQITFNQGHEKAKELESKVQVHVATLIHSPAFESRFPELFVVLAKRIQKTNESEAPSPSDWIGESVTRHLDKGNICVSVEFARKIQKAHQQVQQLSLNGFGGINSKEYRLLSQFLRSYLSFLDKNAMDCESFGIWSALTDELFRYQAKEFSREDLSEKINETLRALDTSYLAPHVKGITAYSATILSTIEKIVLFTAKSLVEPDQITHARGNNPLEMGFGLRHNLMERARTEQIRQVTQDEEFKRTAIEGFGNVFGVIDKYTQAADEKERFAVARDVITRFNESPFAEVPATLRLNALCVISRNSQEFPEYFKKLALDLCGQINPIEKPAVEEIDETELGCAIC